MFSIYRVREIGNCSGFLHRCICCVHMLFVECRNVLKDNVFSLCKINFIASMNSKHITIKLLKSHE